MGWRLPVNPHSLCSLPSCLRLSPFRLHSLSRSVPLSFLLCLCFLLPSPGPSSLLLSLCLLLSLPLSPPLSTPFVSPHFPLLSIPFSAFLPLQPLLTAPLLVLSGPPLPPHSVRSGLAADCEVSLRQLLPAALPPPPYSSCLLTQAFSFPLSAPPSFPLLSPEAPSAPSCLPWSALSVPLPSTSISHLCLPSLCPPMVPIPEPPAASPHTGLCPSPFRQHPSMAPGGDH